MVIAVFAYSSLSSWCSCLTRSFLSQASLGRRHATLQRQHQQQQQQLLHLTSSKGSTSTAMASATNSLTYALDFDGELRTVKPPYYRSTFATPCLNILYVYLVTWCYSLSPFVYNSSLLLAVGVPLFNLNMMPGVHVQYPTEIPGIPTVTHTRFLGHLAPACRLPCLPCLPACSLKHHCRAGYARLHQTSQNETYDVSGIPSML